MAPPARPTSSRIPPCRPGEARSSRSAVEPPGRIEAQGQVRPAGLPVEKSDRRRGSQVSNHRPHTLGGRGSEGNRHADRRQGALAPPPPSSPIRTSSWFYHKGTAFGLTATQSNRSRSIQLGRAPSSGSLKVRQRTVAGSVPARSSRIRPRLPVKSTPSGPAIPRDLLMLNKLSAMACGMPSRGSWSCWGPGPNGI